MSFRGRPSADIQKSATSSSLIYRSRSAPRGSATAGRYKKEPEYSSSEEADRYIRFHDLRSVSPSVTAASVAGAVGNSRKQLSRHNSSSRLTDQKPPSGGGACFDSGVSVSTPSSSCHSSLESKASVHVSSEGAQRKPSSTPVRQRTAAKPTYRKETMTAEMAPRDEARPAATTAPDTWQEKESSDARQTNTVETCSQGKPTTASNDWVLYYTRPELEVLETIVSNHITAACRASHQRLDRANGALDKVRGYIRNFSSVLRRSFSRKRGTAAPCYEGEVANENRRTRSFHNVYQASPPVPDYDDGVSLDYSEFYLRKAESGHSLSDVLMMRHRSPKSHRRSSLGSTSRHAGRTEAGDLSSDEHPPRPKKRIGRSSSLPSVHPQVPSPPLSYNQLRCRDDRFGRTGNLATSPVTLEETTSGRRDKTLPSPRSGGELVTRSASASPPVPADDSAEAINEAYLVSVAKQMYRIGYLNGLSRGQLIGKQGAECSGPQPEDSVKVDEAAHAVASSPASQVEEDPLEAPVTAVMLQAVAKPFSVQSRIGVDRKLRTSRIFLDR